MNLWMEKMTDNLQPTEYRYRAYFIGNMYLSSIQQGIQAAHVLQEMNNEYCLNTTNAGCVLYEWATRDKTIILLNGGYSSNLQELYEKLFSLTHNGTVFPVAKFHEERDSLNGALTSVGIIVPNTVYELEIPEFDSWDLLKKTYEPIKARDMEISIMLRSLRLAA